MYSYSRRRNVITPLQILSFYTKSKPIHMFLFTLLYLRRIKSMQYINPPIIVRLPERNGALHCAAHFCVYVICATTNNVEQKNIETKTQTNFYINNHFVFSKIYSIHFPFWRRYTFLSHLTTKSKISVRWIKKLVAATHGVYLIIKLYCT